MKAPDELTKSYLDNNIEHQKKQTLQEEDWDGGSVFSTETSNDSFKKMPALFSNSNIASIQRK